jgi:transketolase
MAEHFNSTGLSDLDKLSVETIRFLSMEGVQKANSGHPGMPMGMAAAAYTLWMRHLQHSPSNSKWAGRDRFVLSAGHGSMLLYSLLHLTGYDVSLDDLKSFRQWSSKTPGHPEYGHTDGVEVTTGPLGQGIANAVGMAIAEKHLAARYNRDGFDVFDYNIYTISGDGCLQEGISSEASSLAGHLGLDNLIMIYDDNYITIDGDTSLSFTEDRAKRYESYGWYVQVIGGDGNDMEAFDKAMENAKAEKTRPSIIQLRTNIGFGSPNFENSSSAHGAPLGNDEIRLIKQKYGWDPEKTFYVPEEVSENMLKSVETGKALEKAYDNMMVEYAKAYPELAQELADAIAGKITIDIDSLLPEYEPGSSVATRKASGDTLNALMPSMPLVLGGSADLTPSNNTWFKGAEDFQKDNRTGRYIRYGVREHAMGAIMNGIAVSDILRPYGGTFMVFSDYMRPAIRVAALSNYKSIFVFTHDSIGVGEDGPTHQPVEHVAVLRAIPNLLVFRPADANETVQMWKYILQYKGGPVVTALTRQNLPNLDQKVYASAENLTKGAYTLIGDDNPQIILMATGSEVQLVIKAYEQLTADGIKASVVSMPCFELFEKQDKAYRDSVLPPSVTARIAVEAGIEQGWGKYLGTDGIFIGMSSFGASAPGATCFEKFGITAENVIKAAKTF